MKRKIALSDKFTSKKPKLIRNKFYVDYSIDIRDLKDHPFQNPLSSPSEGRHKSGTFSNKESKSNNYGDSVHSTIENESNNSSYKLLKVDSFDKQPNKNNGKKHYSSTFWSKFCR